MSLPPLPSDDPMIQRKRIERMRRFDALSPEMRELVREYGYHVVDQFITLGVKKPAHIRHLVETVLNDFSPTRGSYSRQGIFTAVNDKPVAE